MLEIPVPARPVRQKNSLIQARIPTSIHSRLKKKLPKGATVGRSIARLIEHLVENDLVNFYLEGTHESPRQPTE